MVFRIFLIASLLVTPLFALAKEPLNVILVIVDSLSAKHLSPYGYYRDTSPFLGRFARQNVLFENVSSQAAYTLTSTFSIFTGTFPHTHRIITPPEFVKGTPAHLDPEIKTIAEHFVRAGYETRWIGLKDDPQMGIGQGIQRGFVRIEHGELNSPTVRAGLAELGESKQRFFMFLHSNAVHDPYLPAPRHQPIFLTAPARKLIPDKPSLVASTQKRLSLKPREIPSFNQLREEYIRQFNVHSGYDRNLLTAMYDSSVRTVDDELRALVDNLKMNGLYDNTILVITADHGEAFWEHDKNFHSTPFRPEIHVPLIMRIPGQSPKRISERAQSVDILPTLLDLTGIKIPKYLEGVTLTPLLKDKKIARDEDDHFYSIGYASEAMWNKTWKLIAFQDGQTALFDLYLDPYEENNIAQDHPKIVNQLKAKIAAYKLKRQKKENR